MLLGRHRRGNLADKPPFVLNGRGRVDAMVLDDSYRFHYVGRIASPGRRGLPDTVMDNPGLLGSVAASCLRPAVARAVFNGMVITCRRLRPATLLP